MMKHTMIVTTLITLSVCLAAAQGKPDEGLPTQADNIGKIKTALMAVKGFGSVNSAHFERWDHQVYAAWWCPYSGRDTSHVVAYYFDSDQKKWIRFVETQVDGSHDLSAEMPCSQGTLVFKNIEGKEVLKYSISKYFEKNKTESTEQPPERDK